MVPTPGEIKDVIDKFAYRRGKFEHCYGESAYVPTQLDGLVQVMDVISKKYLSPSHSLSLDVGSGDGRFVFLAHHYGFSSYGLEYNDGLLELSQEIAYRLDIDSDVTLAHGNWKELSSYDQFNKNFSDFNLFYLYPSAGGLQSIFDMFDSYCSSETILCVRRSSENLRTLMPNGIRHCELVGEGLDGFDIFAKK